MVIEGLNEHFSNATLCVQSIFHAHNVDKIQQFNMSAVWTLALD